VKRLPKMERFLIEERYMSEDAEYLTDFNVYYHKFQPPISEKTYSKIRWKAFYKLALELKYCCYEVISKHILRSKGVEISETYLQSKRRA
jgi:hypothetical protein